MITIRNEKFYCFNENKSESVMQIDVATRSELPELDGISGRILHQGSTALIISEGKIAVLGGDGNWYINGEVIE
ncbi:MAG: hypothetical protein K2N27_10585 [Ruminococcus sp.]|nr:hypothetical protein [Ruminococcus sp.]